MVVIGDAPPLARDGVEPISGITSASLIAQSISLDPVAITAANADRLDISDIAEGTGGSVINSRAIAATITEVINTTSAQPFAWLGVSYSGRVGAPITFDASGSYDTAGEGIASYEWDFEGDGSFDVTTASAVTTFTYDAAFDGVVVVRVTSVNGRTALGSTLVFVDAEGGVPMQSGVCHLDADGNSIIVVMRAASSSTVWPTTYQLKTWKA